MEDNLKRIVTESLRLCRERDVKANEFTIAYMACLQEVRKAIDSPAVAPGASLLNPLEPGQVAKIAQLVVKLLAEKDSPILAAMQTQVSMEVIFKQQREVVEQEQLERLERVDMARRAVAGATPGRASTAAAHDKLYARVLEFISLAGGMELALSDEGAKEEVRAALGSVFPLSSLARFLTLTEEERNIQLDELARITLGVCLFNRSVGRGGLALPPGAASYLPQANRLLRDIGRHVTELGNEVEGCAALMRLYAPKQQPDGSVSQDPQHIAQRERAQAEAIHKAQCLVLFEGLAVDLANGLDAVNALESEMQHLLMQVQDSVGGSSAVPKEMVFPVFERLGAIHQALSEELRLLVVRQRLADELAELTGGYVTLLQRMAKSRRPGRKTPVEEELSRLAGLEAGWEPHPPAQMSDSCEYTPPPPALLERGLSANGSTRGGSSSIGSASSSSRPPWPVADQGPEAVVSSSLTYSSMALNGFDAVLLVKEGQLRRSHLRLGTIKQGDAVFGFASPDSMAAFVADPPGAMSNVHSIISRQPVLARLLGRTAAYPPLDLHTIVTVLSQPLKVDFGCQTPVHFVERHIDYRYEWNEWALRRRALALANLRQKATHGTQTGLTHFKRDAEAQVWQPKAAAVQTRVVKGQSMPKKLQYVAGLRGAPDTKMNVIRLELELGQPHQY